jgi:hypothetical protein
VYHYTTRTTPGLMLECVGLTWDIDTEQTWTAPFRGPAVHARVPSGTPQDSFLAPGTHGRGTEEQGSSNAPTGSFAPLPTNACTHTHARQCGVGQGPARGCRRIYSLQGGRRIRTAHARMHLGTARRGRRMTLMDMLAALARRHLHGPERGDCRQAQNADTHC